MKNIILFFLVFISYISGSLLWAMDYVEVCEKPNKCKKISRLIMGTDHVGKRSNQELLYCSPIKC